MTEKDHTHVGDSDTVANPDAQFEAPRVREPGDPARYRKVIAGAIVALLGWLLTRYGVDVDRELEKALLSFATLVTVYLVPNDD